MIAFETHETNLLFYDGVASVLGYQQRLKTSSDRVHNAFLPVICQSANLYCPKYKLELTSIFG